MWDVLVLLAEDHSAPGESRSSSKRNGLCSFQTSSAYVCELERFVTMQTGVLLCLIFTSKRLATAVDFCPSHFVLAKDPGPECQTAKDPRNLKKSPIEEWFTEEMFQDLFPRANLGLGPHGCLPYSYKSFVIAARYFPEFGGETLNKDYDDMEHQRRDVAAFFAHALQETGENDVSLYNSSLSTEEASNCFYRGGFYNWIERGPNSSFLLPAFPGFQLVDSKRCVEEGKYCKKDSLLNFWYPCNETTETHLNSTYYRGCYFGRGALQLSWNYNYGLFQQFLLSRGFHFDLINNPNLVLTEMHPPLAMLASLWFYMTPQPPKPSMHSIIIGRWSYIGNWRQSEKNRRAGFTGPIFGPTSLVINNECGGEDPHEPGDVDHGGPGESRRIKAFKWFCNYFGVPTGSERSLSCKGMLDNFDAVPHMYTWQPDWGNMWRARACDCEPAAYGGPLPYYDPKFYPSRFTKENDRNRLRCVYSIYKSPQMFRLNHGNAPCLKYKPRIVLTKSGFKNDISRLN